MPEEKNYINGMIIKEKSFDNGGSQLKVSVKVDEFIEELKKNHIDFRGPLILGKGESVHFKDPDGNHLEIRCPADLKSPS